MQVVGRPYLGVTGDRAVKKMDFDDREDEELCESDFRGIVADAESSIYNIKKQLLIVQTLRNELIRKEAIISALNSKICDLEKDSLQSSQYFHENRILVERSYQLERASEASKNEHFLLTKQVVTQSQRADSLEEELDSLVKNNAEKRTQSEDLQKEFAIVRTQLGATEEILRDIKSKNEALRYDIRRIELDGLKIRNDAKKSSNQAEEKSQQMKDKCLTLERNVLESDSILKEQRDLIDEWTLKHEGLTNQLSDKQSEIDHWKRIYNEQVSHIHTFVMRACFFLPLQYLHRDIVVISDKISCGSDFTLLLFCFISLFITFWFYDFYLNLIFFS